MATSLFYFFVYSKHNTTAVIIEAVTEEIDFVPHKAWHDKQRYDMRVLRMQCACTVGDQHFESYAIMNERGNTTLRSSRVREGPARFSILSIFATFLSLGGYILQFVGCKYLYSYNEPPSFALGTNECGHEP